MSDEHDASSPARDYPPEPIDADPLRGLSQRAAAPLLNVEERTMRQWCAGQGKPPASLFRAPSPRLTHTENLRRMIESNENTIEALLDRRVTVLGYGPGLSDPRSVAAEIDRLRRRNEEHRALVRWIEAFQRKQEAYMDLQGHWLPHGNDRPTAETISELHAAEEEFRAAQAEVARITQEMRGGKRKL